MGAADHCSVELLPCTGIGIGNLHGITSLRDYNVEFSVAGGTYPVLWGVLSNSPTPPPPPPQPTGLDWYVIYSKEDNSKG